MQTAALIALGSLLLLTLATLVVGLHFVWLIGRAEDVRGPSGASPRVAVLLALRGADAHLADVLRRLLDQDYPDYTVSVVVDSEHDPAWEVANAVLRADSSGRLSVATLKDRRPTCGRKCSALVQMLQELEPGREVIAQVDADVLPHRAWLRQLVAPLSDPRVGLTFGNRWYAPAPGWGTLLRYLWNASSVATMHLLRTPWAGSCAVRKSTLDRVRAGELWSRAAVDDASIRTAIVREGLRVRFVPSLMILNREASRLPDVFRFVTRQLAWTRIYIPGVWAQSIGLTAAVAGVLAGSAAVTGLSLLRGAAAEAGLCLAGFAAVLTSYSGVVYLMDRAVRKQVGRRGETTVDSFTPALLARLVAAIPAYYGLHLAAVCAAQFKRTIEWRGIRYLVRGPWDVQVLEDRAAVPEGAPAPEVSA